MAKSDENAFSDDDMPADVNFQDPYFAEELSKQENQMNGMMSCVTIVEPRYLASRH